jgi:hypothetical protein
MTTTRRAFLITATAAAPAMALPAIALPSSSDATASRLWAERQSHVERLCDLTSAYEAASAKVPAWAQPGLDRIDRDGKPCGSETGWPLDPDITPPPIGERIVRPTIGGCVKEFHFFTSVFCSDHKVGRQLARARMREQIRVIVARLRERQRLYDQLGLTDLTRRMEAAVDATISAESFFRECDDETPNIVAPRILIDLCYNCTQSSSASGHGYCGTMAMALVALNGLLPNLSGLIREHAAFFVGNPELPLSDMPFAPD